MDGRHIDSIPPIAVPMLRMMCREVAGQKRRLGGDFAVAWLLLSRRMRDIAREACPDRDDAIVTFT